MLTEGLVASPLRDGQRVLALTFMHGARRRLAERLGSVSGLGRRVECCTVDGFAWRLVRRWRGLVAALGVGVIGEAEYDRICDTAGLLLEQPEVQAWVAVSFPIVLVDEGQDLKPERLRMLRALSAATHTLIAADEFQCLDQALRPNPLVAWLQAAARPETLAQVRRTDVAGLLAAAVAVRNGQKPVDGKGFRIMAGPPGPFASTLLANAIAWRDGADVAVITPSLQGGYAQAVVASVAQQKWGKQQNGPYTIHWEGSDRDEAELTLAMLQMNAAASAADTILALRALPHSATIRAVLGWVENQIHAVGRVHFERSVIEELILRQIALRRQRGAAPSYRFTAMTVQQAKNREFDGVVILWPFQVGGDAEHKRRLLYNGITRARRWCNVIVQNKKILQAPPFT